MNNKQYLYQVRWSQPYLQADGIKETLVTELIELYLEQGWFEEANIQLKRIMSL